MAEPCKAVVKADQGCTGQQAKNATSEQGIDFQVVKLPEAIKGFVLLLKRWVVSIRHIHLKVGTRFILTTRAYLDNYFFMDIVCRIDFGGFGGHRAARAARAARYHVGFGWLKWTPESRQFWI